MRVTFFYFLMFAPIVSSLFAADFKVNTTTSYDQTDPAVAIDAQGNFIIVWHSCLQDRNSGDILAQRFDADGTPTGTEFQINSEPGSPNQPAVAMTPNGDFVVAWHGPGTDQEDIFARRFNAATTPLGNQFQVNSITAGRQLFPAIAAAPDGNFVIVWQSNAAQPQDQWNVCFQLYNSSGSPVGTEQNANLFPDSFYPDVAMDDYGRFTITWMQDEAQHIDNQVMFRMYNNDGSPKTDPNSINTTPFYTVTYPSVSCAASGHFVVTWQAHPSTAVLNDIYARWYRFDGSPKCAQFIVNTHTDGAQQNPKVAMNDQRDFIVVWNSNGDIHARRFKTSNSFVEPIGDEFIANTYTFSDQKHPAAAIKENRDFLVVWQSDGQDESGYGIFAAAGPQISCADFTDDLFVNFRDYCFLANHWLIADLIDDNIIDYYDLDAFSNQWLTSCYDCVSTNFNNDSSIDSKDFALFAKNWLKQGPNLTGDINSDGYINATDLKILISHWLEPCQ
jgi:hypothetical protein